jgi:hypothetical protein
MPSDHGTVNLSEFLKVSSEMKHSLVCRQFLGLLEMN